MALSSMIYLSYKGFNMIQPSNRPNLHLFGRPRSTRFGSLREVRRDARLVQALDLASDATWVPQR